MKKRFLAALLSMSIVASIVPVYAQNTEKEVEPMNGYQTDRFIIETTEANPINMETSEAAKITAVETAVNDALSEMKVTTETSEVISIDDNNKVITLTEEVDAEEFIESMEDNMGKSTVSIHPDYPVYMNSVETENEEESGDEDVVITDYTDFQTNLTAAKGLSTGTGARVAVLGSYYNVSGSSNYIVDVTNYVSNNYNGSGSTTTESKIISLIHSVAPSTSIIPIGVFTEISSSNGGQYQAYTSDIVKGIQYAQNHGAHIVVCDWYTNEYNEYLERKMNEAQMLFTTSAGPVREQINYMPMPVPTAVPESYNAVYPACFDVSNMITVSALYSDYSRKYDVDYDDHIDLYSVSQYTDGTNSLDNASSATAYVAACAALVYGYNNSANNLKSIIMNGAFDVNYLPGQSGYVNYKALSFYDAVTGNTNSETIDITTSHSTNNDYSTYISGIEKIYYADIKQVVAGTNSIAVLLNDGTVKLCALNNTHPYINYFGLDYSRGFVTVPGFPNNTTIEKIAMSADGTALAAVDSAGDLYVLGKKTELGESSSGAGSDAYYAVHKEESISNATDVYLNQSSIYVKKTDSNVEKLMSRGSNIYRSDNNYEFGEIAEAADCDDIDFYDSKMAFVKDGAAYLSSSSTSGPTYFYDVNMNTSSPVAEVELTYNKMYIRTSDKTLYYADTSGSTAPSAYSIEGNVSKLAGSNNMLFYAKDLSGSQYDNYFYTVGSNMYNTYTSSIPKTTTLSSICEFGEAVSSSPNYSDIPYGTYLLTDDQTLYQCGLYNSNSSSSSYPTVFSIVAQKNFTPQAIDSVVPVNIEEQYGSETLNQTLAEILDDATDGKATITLADGTDVVVPVTWPTTGFDATQLGTQPFTGTLSLPQGITQPTGVDAVANISIKAPITDVSNTQINADHDDTKAEIIAQLPSTVEVTITKPANPDDPPLILPVTWDTTTFDPQPSSTYTIYGHIQTNNEICNPYDKVSVATITVGNPPDSNVVSIFPQDNINVPYNTPITMIDLPDEVTVTLSDNSTTDLNVNWDISQYNPTLAETPQTLEGTLVTREGIANTNNLKAYINIIVAPEAVGEIQSIDTIYISADQSVPFEQIQSVPQYVTVTTANGSSTLLPVTWNSTYNPDPDFLTGNQIVLGTVTINDRIANTNNIPAVLIIQINPASYTADTLSPNEDSISVDYGTSYEQIKTLYNNTVIVGLINTATEETIDVAKTLQFDDVANETYNATTPGVYNLIARPVLTNNIQASSDLYFTLHVTVNNKRTITNVTVNNASTYQYTSFEDVNLPGTATVSLNDGTTKSIAVDWDEEMYDSATIGTHIVLGTFVDFPISVEESTLYQPVLSLSVLQANYEITDIIYGDVETVYAGMTLDELEDSLTTNTVSVEISANENGTFITNIIDIPFSINQDQVAQSDLTGDELYYYIPDEVGTYILPTKLTLPDNVSFEDGYDIDIESDYDLVVDTEPVDLTADTITEFDKTVIRGTTFNDLELEQTVSVVLESGKTVDVPIIWNDEDYDEYATESVIEGIVTWPDYINGYIAGTPVEFFYTITTTEAETFTLVSITPNELPTSGVLEVNLGTTLAEIKQLLGVMEVTALMKDSAQVEHTELITFDLLASDNPTFSTTTAGYYELIAHLNLGDNILNPNNVQLKVKVETVVKTIKAVSSVRVTGVARGTAFADINMPTTVSVTFTDNTTDQINVTWDGSNYNPNRIGSQRVTGTLYLPVYMVNPNNRTATAIITVVAGSNMQLLSLSPQQSPILRMNTMSMFRATRSQSRDDVIEHKYLAEYLNEDGTITTEEISFFDIIE